MVQSTTSWFASVPSNTPHCGRARRDGRDVQIVGADIDAADTLDALQPGVAVDARAAASVAVARNETRGRCASSKRSALPVTRRCDEACVACGEVAEEEGRAERSARVVAALAGDAILATRGDEHDRVRHRAEGRGAEREVAVEGRHELEGEVDVRGGVELDAARRRRRVVRRAGEAADPAKGGAVELCDVVEDEEVGRVRASHRRVDHADVAARSVDAVRVAVVAGLAEGVVDDEVTARGLLAGRAARVRDEVRVVDAAVADLAAVGVDDAVATGGERAVRTASAGLVGVQLAVVALLALVDVAVAAERLAVLRVGAVVVLAVDELVAVVVLAVVADLVRDGAGFVVGAVVVLAVGELVAVVVFAVVADLVRDRAGLVVGAVVVLAVGELVAVVVLAVVADLAGVAQASSSAQSSSSQSMASSPSLSSPSSQISRAWRRPAKFAQSSSSQSMASSPSLSSPSSQISAGGVVGQAVVGAVGVVAVACASPSLSSPSSHPGVAAARLDGAVRGAAVAVVGVAVVAGLAVFDGAVAALRCRSAAFTFRSATTRAEREGDHRAASAKTAAAKPPRFDSSCQGTCREEEWSAGSRPRWVDFATALANEPPEPCQRVRTPRCSSRRGPRRGALGRHEDVASAGVLGAVEELVAIQRTRRAHDARP